MVNKLTSNVPVGIFKIRIAKQRLLEGEEPPQKMKTPKEDKNDSRPCEKCSRPFIPKEHWHSVCNNCYTPKGETTRKYARCEGCKIEFTVNNLVDGLCGLCQD